jgi:heptaprenylglyceryl phosphate synthase
MMHVKFDTRNLMDKFARMVDDITQVDVDEAVTQALDEVADDLLEEMQAAVKRHYRTGSAYEAVKRTEVQRAGNYQWVEVGAMYIRAEDRDGFHIVYLEYGSPTLAADPWLRPAMEKRAQINQIILNAFREQGVPNVKAA